MLSEPSRSLFPYQQEFGYPELTAERKAKILGTNAGRVYGLDMNEVRNRSRGDEVAWVKQALEHWVSEDD